MFNQKTRLPQFAHALVRGLAATATLMAALAALIAVLVGPTIHAAAADPPPPVDVTLSAAWTPRFDINVSMAGVMEWLTITVTPVSGGGVPAGSIQVVFTGMTLPTCTATLNAQGEARCALIPPNSGNLSAAVTFTPSRPDLYNPKTGSFSRLVGALALTPQILAGRGATCYLNAAGSLRCWGDSSSIPVDGSGNPITVSAYTAVSVGGYHTCAIKPTGELQCWGGDPTITAVPAGEFFAVSAGNDFACALDKNFKVQCWGSVPSAVTNDLPSDDFRSLSAGSADVCAIRHPARTGFCWGASGLGEFSQQIRQVAVGVSHACAINESDGALSCKGSLTSAPAGASYASIDSGSNYACAVKSDNTLVCWGPNAPTIDNASIYTAMSAGFLHVCALKNKTGGGSYLDCWSSPAGNNRNQAPRLSLAPAAIPPYLPQNRPFSQTLTPSGGAPNYTISANMATLPPGLTLAASEVITGLLSGSPTTTGSFNFVLYTYENFANSTLPLELAPRGAAYATVVQDPGSTVGIALSPTAAVAGQPVLITASVTKLGTPALSGTVTIWTDEVGSSCTVAVSGNSGQCSLSFEGAGLRTVYAQYNGDSFYTPSSQNSTTIAISAPTITPDITAGNAFNISLNGSGALYGWGKNDSNQISPLPNNVFSQASAGLAHVCGRRLNGVITCWGWNGYGQAVPPAGNTFALAAAGGRHTCAVQYSGAISCWGDSADNRLAAPSAITFVTAAGGLTAGSDHTCALRADNHTAVCWGVSSGSRLNAPATAFNQISAGGAFTCGLRQSNGELECWGSGSAVTGSPTGVAFKALSAGGAHACAIDMNNDLSCWGNLPGDLPASVVGDFKAVASGQDHTCALTSNNKVQCWGVNTNQQAPRLSFAPAAFARIDLGQSLSTPLVISGGRESLFNFVSPASLLPPGVSVDGSSGLYSGAATEAGVYTFPITVTERTLSLGLIATKVYTQVVRSPVDIDVVDVAGWGSAVRQGQPVQITVGISETPGTRLTALGLRPSGSVTVQSDDGATCDAALTSGQGHCVLFFTTPGTKHLTLSYAGDNYYMPLAANAPYALSVAAYEKSLSLHTPNARTDAHLPDGSLVCWGSACPGSPPALAAHFAAGPSLACRIGMDGAALCDPAGVLPASGQNYGFIGLSVGWDHACAVRYDGSLACWGDDTGGKATPPAGVFKTVSSGRRHTCAIRQDDSLACWGDLPAAAPAGAFQQVATGDGHDCAVKMDGSLVCWGGDAFGQAAPPSGTFKEIVVGANHSCAVGTDNRIRCWGQNTAGQSSAPYGQFLTLAAFGDHTCALRSGPKLTCWGANANGQAPRINVLPLTTTSLVARQYFEHFFNPSGGRKPYSAHISSGALPRGLALTLDASPAGVVLYGYPQWPNVFSFNLFWEDAGVIPLALEQPMTLTVTGAELGVTIQPSHPQGALWGSPVSLRYNLDNATALPVPTSRLTVTLPAGLTDTVYSGLSGCTLAGLTLVCPIDPFPGAGTQYLVVTGTVTAPIGAVLTTTAKLQPTAVGWPELEPLDNTAAASMTVGLTSLILNDDFDLTPPDAGWSGGSVITTTTGVAYLGDFTASDSLRLQIPNLPPHKRIRVSFDVYVIGDWAGNAAPVGTWQFGQFGLPPQLATTFCNTAACTQAYPQAYPGGAWPGLTAAAGSEELGLASTPDARYQMGAIFDHDAALLDLLFKSTNLPLGARWGIDNVKVWLDGGLAWLFMPAVSK